jgi:hypothetical protein
MKDVKPFEESEQMFQKANSKKNSSKALLKAVEIAGDIISGRVTFVGTQMAKSFRGVQIVA